MRLNRHKTARGLGGSVRKFCNLRALQVQVAAGKTVEYRPRALRRFYAPRPLRRQNNRERILPFFIDEKKLIGAGFGGADDETVALGISLGCETVDFQVLTCRKRSLGVFPFLLVVRNFFEIDAGSAGGGSIDAGIVACGRQPAGGELEASVFEQVHIAEATF